ncbi:hypothetical protein AUC43_11800 [Hymenobacter sedentarius]|uniref:Uncharacterized protein n=1 Tax=Hymenobacter sedentarius TaxID=1411621 RepID=A0A0U4CQN7_9BACT|nr:CZB domain-containing protein [Hymenobacter sedentarius]ALW85710.1 hypothetical protein AUC43_11800 [Hymenobacter sedentarius]
MALTSFDFQQARVKQVLFKSRLRSVLYGVRAAEPELFSIHDNPLGQWLQTAVKPTYGAYPEVREIERVLQQMLHTGRDLAARYSRGLIEESRTGLDQINGYAAQIETLLTDLEKAVTAKA